MAMLIALGLTPPRAMPPGAGVASPVNPPQAGTGNAGAKGSGMQSPEMTALVARFQQAMARIKALESAKAPEAAGLKRAAIAAGNLSTSAKGIVDANAALARVEAQLGEVERKASAGGTVQKPPAVEQPGAREGGPASTGNVPPKETNPQETAAQAKPEFKGYPSTLQKSEKLIGQIKKYGFSEGKHATTMDAADRGDVQEIWCSGLSNWALAESGFDLDAPIPGKTYFEKVKKKNKKTGEEELVTVEKPVTLRSLVEGYKETFADTKEEAEGAASYAQEGLFGKTPAEDDPRVKGAAGAFVLAGIGKEILDLEDVKPGDFAQTRQVGSPDGHAFQIHACLCEGECLIGAGNAPTLVSDLGGEVIDTAEGKWYGKASFRIDGTTSPLLVGAHKVVKSDWLESNLASKMEDKSDKDGGVQVRHGAKFEDPTKGGKRTYVGRLTGSSWSGYSRADPPLKKPQPRTSPAQGT